MSAVVDTVVFYRAMFGSRIDTASRTVTGLVVDQRIQAFSSDIFMGEIVRIIMSDPKLRGLDNPYLHNYLAMIQASLTMVDIKYLEYDKNWLKLIGNDWFLIALARFKKVDYLITHDKKAFLNRRETDWKDEDYEIVTSAEFLKKNNGSY